LIFRFLGTCDSGGIPVHNCDCLACKIYRKEKKVDLSTSAAIEYEDSVILLDAGIEDISTIYDGKNIKAVFLTHFHADHAMGLLRLRYSNDKIKCFHPKDEMGFSDLFKHKQSIEYIKNSPLEIIEIDNILFSPIPLKHSKNTTGYIIKTKNKTIAYLTDCAGIEEEYLKFLKNIKFDHIFIDACFIPPKTGNHLNFEDAINLIDNLDTKQAHLIHKSHKTLEYIMKNNIDLKYKYVDKNFNINI